MNTTIKFKDKDYRVKYILEKDTLKPLVFASQELADDLVANTGKDAKAIDAKITFYFPALEFGVKSARELFDSQNGVFNKTISL